MCVPLEDLERAEPVSQITLSKIKNGHTVTKGTITKIKKPRIVLYEGAFMCKSCMKIHKIIQNINAPIQSPAVCNECGGQDFTLISEDSCYQYLHEVILSDSDNPITLTLQFIDDETTAMDYNAYQLYKYDVVTVVGNINVINNMLVMVDVEELHNQLGMKLMRSNVEQMREEQKNIADTPEITRSSKQYLQWREHVLGRDTNCKLCGSSENLVAHHLFGFEEYPQLRADEGNGVILCRYCHNSYHNKFKEITPRSFIEFMKNHNPSKTKMSKGAIEQFILNLFDEAEGDKKRLSEVFIESQCKLEGISPQQMEDCLIKLQTKGIIFVVDYTKKIFQFV